MADGGPFLDVPLDVAATGGLRTTDADDHLRDLVLQVLFTEPGERVNLPQFGCGVKRLLFAPSNDALRAAARFLITQNLQRWLGDRIDVQSVDVTSEPGEEETVTIDIAYVARATGAPGQVRVQA